MSMNREPKEAVRKVPTYDAMLYQICREEDIKLEFLCTNWVKRLTKQDKVRYINGHKFDINSYAAGEVADDKAATYEILKSQGVPAAEHVLLYDFSNQASYTLGRNSLDYIEEYFAQNDNHIVVKSSRGYCGVGVVQVTDKEQFIPTIIELFYGNPVLCMCPFYNIKHEHRVIMLDGEARLTYQKNLADPEQWKFNLSAGATTEKTPAELYNKLVELAKQAMRALGLRFCSVDIAELESGELMVLEVNSGVMTDKYLQQNPEKYPEVREMYKEAVKRMFEG